MSNAGADNFRMEDLNRRVNLLEAALPERETMWRQRFHTIEASIAAVNLLCSRIPDLDKRIEDLEALNVNVIARDVRYLDKRVDSMAKAMWGVAGSLIVAVVVFALSVASGQLG